MRKSAVIVGMVLSLLSLLIVHLAAQTKPKAAYQDLFHTIAKLDSSVFDAYNRRDLEKFAGFFSEDLEFYHDKGGVTRSRESLVEGVRKNICGKVQRELVPGTLEVYPMDGYGALEIGVHRFLHPKAAPGEPVGEAKFIHLWQNANGVWKITRVISYDHRSLRK